jgi:type IV secretory pathway VirB10-like protein
MPIHDADPPRPRQPDVLTAWGEVGASLSGAAADVAFEATAALSDRVANPAYVERSRRKKAQRAAEEVQQMAASRAAAAAARAAAAAARAIRQEQEAEAERSQVEEAAAAKGRLQQTQQRQAARDRQLRLLQRMMRITCGQVIRCVQVQVLYAVGLCVYTWLTSPMAATLLPAGALGVSAWVLSLLLLPFDLLSLMVARVLRTITSAFL